MKFRDLFGRLRAATASDTVAAVASDLKLTARQREYLLPLIEGEVHRLMREEVRGVERKVFRRGRAVEKSDRRSTLLSRMIQLPDGRCVTWGEMTIEDHLTRIEALTKLRDGVQKTIDQHTRVIELLRSAGAACLNDIDDLDLDDLGDQP